MQTHPPSPRSSKERSPKPADHLRHGWLATVLITTAICAQAGTQMGNSSLPGLVRGTDGKPIVGAEVRAVDLLDAPQMPGGFMPQRPRPFVTTETDDNGKFVLTGIPSAGVMVEIEKPGYFVHTVPYALAKAAIVASLEPSGFVTGNVVDANGRPLKAQLTLYFEGYWGEELHETDAKGRFRVNLAHRGKYALRVRALPDLGGQPIRQILQPGTFEGPQEDLRLQFGSTMEMHGTVRLEVRDATGKPITRFRGMTNWDRTNRNTNRRFHEDTIAQMLDREGFDSDDAGVLNLSGPTAAQSLAGRVLVCAPGYLSKVVEVKFANEGAGRGGDPDATKPVRAVVVELERAGSVVGKVVDDRTRKPLVGLSVAAMSNAPRGQVMTRVGRGAETDADGSFRLDGLGGREYSIRVMSNRRTAAAVRVTAKPGRVIQSGELRVRLLSVTGQLAGLPDGARVTLPAKIQRIASRVLAALAARGGRANTASGNRIVEQPSDAGIEVDAAGRFAFDGVVRGQYELVAWLPQPIGPPVGVTVDTVRVVAEDVELALDSIGSRLGRIDGKIRFTRAAIPWGRVLVVANQPQRNGMRGTIQNRTVARAIAAADGSFSILVSPGRYFLRTIDLATGVVVHESAGSFDVGAGKTVTPTTDIALGLVRVSIEPENGAMSILSHVEIAVEDGGVRDPNRARTASSATSGGLGGLPLLPGATSIALLLPTKKCTLRAYNRGLPIASGRPQAGISIRGKVEFTPALGETLEVKLAVSRGN